jgi:hypothetical protein
MLIRPKSNESSNDFAQSLGECSILICELLLVRLFIPEFNFDLKLSLNKEAQTFPSGVLEPNVIHASNASVAKTVEQCL